MSKKSINDSFDKYMLQISWKLDIMLREVISIT